ncbi:MAG: hypothetical protein M0019_01595 [Actinomycetota bacterium]|nr:hypothetical protein [Actinomycetota bacterium]
MAKVRPEWIRDSLLTLLLRAELHHGISISGLIGRFEFLPYMLSAKDRTDLTSESQLFPQGIKGLLVARIIGVSPPSREKFRH